MAYFGGKKKVITNLVYGNQDEVEVWHPGMQGSDTCDVVRPDCNGRIDFLALNEAYQHNPMLMGQSGGKTAAMMTAFCQMNAFNLDNFLQIGEYMKKAENNFSSVIHESNSSTDNKIQITANKISQLDHTVVLLFTEVAQRIMSGEKKENDNAITMMTEIKENDFKINQIVLKYDDKQTENLEIVIDTIKNIEKKEDFKKFGRNG